MTGDRGFLVAVRSVFAWLMVFGVIAGLCGRVLALDHMHPKGQSTDCCDHGQGHDQDHGHPSTGDRSHDDCPSSPHDHPHPHACCHPAPLAGMEMPAHRLLSPDAVWLCVSWLAALPPDEPVFALDKPPLI